jgi:tRNA(Ile)-lysidine synthase
VPAPSASEPANPLTDQARAALNLRLSTSAQAPVAVALSGGGDSVALLAMVADWARRVGRPVLALTVDHGLNADSAGWTRFARDLALSHGAAWRGLNWTGDKPTSGLPAAARLARHRLLADAARAGGASVILLGHTRDDVAEAEWMRAQGSTLGHLRDWSPSPVWPDGRDLMLARPLLGAGRQELRDWLTTQGQGWIEDPTNEDLRFARSRARQALATHPEPAGEPATRFPSALSRPPLQPGAGYAGTIALRRGADASTLAVAIACAGGGEALPRGRRLGTLIQRLATGDDFTASLAGARIEAEGDGLLVMREAGEQRRGGMAPAPLARHKATVWDGRFEIEAGQAGRIGAAAGHLAALDPDDRAALGALPAAARGTVPVLFRDGDARPVLAWRAARVRCLVASRLALATGQIENETELNVATLGEIAPSDLFQRGDGANAA